MLGLLPSGKQGVKSCFLEAAKLVSECDKLVECGAKTGMIGCYQA